MKKKVVATWFLLVSVGGCATYQWVKPGAGPMQLAADTMRCEERAQAAYPANNVIHTELKSVEEQVVCRVAATKDRPAHNSICDQTKVVPIKTTKDLNSAPRAEFVKTCLTAGGWVYSKIE